VDSIDYKYDKICIRDLSLRCIIGIYKEERREKQDIIINIVLYTDLSKACESDDIDDTVDYKKIKKEILRLIENSKFYLIEKIAGEISSICLKDKKVKVCKVTIDKPGALRFSRSAAVEIVRYNS
jgi:FolB domain-containing protein